MFKINPSPTFTAKIDIPVHGGKPEKIEFVFKHKTRKQLQEYLKSTNKMEDPEAILEIAEGWNGVDGEFSLESVTALVDNYHGAAAAILHGYLDQLMQARIKN